MKYTSDYPFNPPKVNIIGIEHESIVNGEFNMCDYSLIHKLPQLIMAIFCLLTPEPNPKEERRHISPRKEEI